MTQNEYLVAWRDVLGGIHKGIVTQEGVYNYEDIEKCILYSAEHVLGVPPVLVRIK